MVVQTSPDDLLTRHGAASFASAGVISTTKGFLQPVPNTESSNSVRLAPLVGSYQGALPVTRLALFLTEILQHLALKF